MTAMQACDITEREFRDFLFNEYETVYRDSRITGSKTQINKIRKLLDNTKSLSRPKENPLQIAREVRKDLIRILEKFKMDISEVKSL